MRDRLIHAEARVHSSARIGIGAFIGRGVVIGPDVTIGNYACIGGLPEHRDFMLDYGATRQKGVVIEAHCRVFEFVTIHGGTLEPTHLSEGVMVQNHSHVGHDCFLGVGAVIGGQVSLAGHTTVMERATVAGKSCTHQFSVIGAHGFLAPMSFLKGDLPPGEIWTGSPARHAGLNEIGLKRAHMTHAQCLERFGDEYERLCRKH